jgi:hypothetical protein
MTATFSGVGGRVKREAGGCRVDVGSGVSRAEREGKERVRERRVRREQARHTMIRAEPGSKRGGGGGGRAW